MALDFSSALDGAFNMDGGLLELGSTVVKKYVATHVSHLEDNTIHFSFTASNVYVLSSMLKDTKAAERQVSKPGA